MTTHINSINISSNTLTISYSKGSSDIDALKQVLKGLNYYDTYIKSCNFKAGSQCPNQKGNYVTIDNGGRVTDITIHNQNLKGFISTDIGHLTNLNHLVLKGNFLEGSIPSDLGLLTNLTMLDLNTNNLKGTIPSELGKLHNLTYLDLSYECDSDSVCPSGNLVGNIPIEII